MTDYLEALKQRLVIGRKSDGRSVYDEAAKAELVDLCLMPGASVSRLARECGINTNQVGRWLRERGQGRERKAATPAPSAASAFVAVPVLPAPSSEAAPMDTRPEMALQAWLPNGVAVELRGVDAGHMVEVLGALGRLRCSASTKG